MERDAFLNKLLEYNSNYNIERIGHAYDLAEEKHEGQLRKSGEPYFIHPVAVSLILAELGMDDDTIMAGLLHDVVEDTEYTIEDLEVDFGSAVTHLVSGVTKLGSIVFENKEQRQAENLRKMFLAMSKDIRVLIIKLADRVHNIRTINYMSEEQIFDKCKETLEIYAPLASRLGIYNIKFEMEDTALKYLYPEEYQDLKIKLKKKSAERKATIDKITSDIEVELRDLGINYEISGRSKHFYSIFKKMKYQNKDIDEIFDLTAVRIIVDSVKDCYGVLGVVHTLWKPIPGRFKDYIAMPKHNMYQSLHTTVIGDSIEPFEIQIRTHEMHEVAEYGIAAHWKYKEGRKKSDSEDVKLSWLRYTLELQQEMQDPKEFMEALKVDLFANQVFVFTPKGDVIELPSGSTPLDFAFKIHSDIGIKCVGAKVDGRMVQISHELKNGNIVDIITSNNSRGPSIDWLKIAKSGSARNKIRQWLKKENRSETVDKGKDVLDKYIRKKAFEPREVVRTVYVNKVVKDLNFLNQEDMYTQIAHGGVIQSKVGSALIDYYIKELKEKEKKTLSNETLENINKRNEKLKTSSPSGIKVAGVDNLMIRVSRCCNPVPGDDIVGFITKGRGISVHRVDCPNAVSLEEGNSDRFIRVYWDQDGMTSNYNVDITIIVEDKKGIFSGISKACDEMDVNIASVNTNSLKEEKAQIFLTLSISNTNQMKKILRELKNVPGVMDAFRSKV